MKHVIICLIKPSIGERDLTFSMSERGVSIDRITILLKLYKIISTQMLRTVPML